MRHLLKHMFAVRIVILMIFCDVHIATDAISVAGNSKTITSDVAPLTRTTAIASARGHDTNVMLTPVMPSVATGNSSSKPLKSKCAAGAMAKHRTKKSVDATTNATTIAHVETNHSSIATTKSSNATIEPPPSSDVNSANDLSVRTLFGGRVFLRFFTALQNAMEFVRTQAKRAWISYNWYQPELEMSKCMMKYARIQYPRMLRDIRKQSINQLGYNVISMFGRILSSAIFGEQHNEFTVENGRIGREIEEMVKPWPTKSSVVSRIRRNHQRRRLPQVSVTPGHLNQNATQAAQMAQVMIITPINMEQSSSEQSQGIEEEQYSRAIRSADDEYDDPGQNIGEQMPATERPNEVKNESVDEANEEAEIDNMFDLESMILRGLGYDPKNIKKNSPTYCGKEYAFGFFRRVIRDFVMA